MQRQQSRWRVRKMTAAFDQMILREAAARQGATTHTRSRMSPQDAWDELVVQIEESTPIRETVIQMLEELLDALKAGEPLPGPCGSA
jgi:hypothetical protein